MPNEQGNINDVANASKRIYFPYEAKETKIGDQSQKADTMIGEREKVDKVETASSSQNDGESQGRVAKKAQKSKLEESEEIPKKRKEH